MPLDFALAEARWQKAWREAKIFEPVPDSRPKYFITFPYPYMNGSPHVGHAFSFVRADVHARFKRAQGFNVLFPFAFHATGQPIIGIVDRLQQNDHDIVANLKLSGASDADIERFKQKGAAEVANFFRGKWVEGITALGGSIDWTRQFITTTLTPTYSRFIEWQYNTLRKKGYVVQGTHPVVWCGVCGTPTGDHDRLKGEGESPIEYTLIKFKVHDAGRELVLPCATLRPETVYGATNIWINPRAEYNECKVTSEGRTETWLLSPEAVRKLQDQKRKVQVLKPIAGSALVSLSALNPATGQRVPILPAEFVDAAHATGIVMSVPAHAPFDYVALRDLQENDAELRHYKLAADEIKAIKPITVLSSPAYAGASAIEEVEKRRIKNQKDVESLEAATHDVYNEEFHKGTLNKNTGKYDGQKVSEAKEKIVNDFAKNNWSEQLWETTAPVVDRSNHLCHVKILENQWFLKFSDEKWKAQVRTHLKSMDIRPETARAWFLNTVDWLKDKACARRTGLGTPLPWDPAWLVETLSDSTIYMAYYTLARTIKDHGITAEQMPDSLFDYAFLNQGTLQQVQKETTLSAEVVARLKQEFEYFYPVDMRSSAKDLLMHHLTFYLFHHAAIFPQKYWPRGIAVNGYVNVEGEKMSKSLGNFIPVADLVREFGADITRLAVGASADALDDADWRRENTKVYRRLLDFLYDTAIELSKITNPKDYAALERPEKLLESRMNRAMREANTAYDKFEYRSAVHSALFETTSAIRDYLETRGNVQNSNAAVLKKALENSIIAIAPFAPHFAEETWHALGRQDFASLAPFPSADSTKIDEKLELEDSYVQSVIEDVKNVMKLTQIKPKALIAYTAPAWKWKLLQTVTNAGKQGKIDYSALLKQALQEEALKTKAPEVQTFLQAVIKNLPSYIHAQRIDEARALAENSQTIERALGFKTLVIRAEDASPQNDPKNKAPRAMPLKPAIYLETT